MENNERMNANPRGEFLRETVNVDQLKGLEIGPLTVPLVTKGELKDQGEIFYLDHMPTEELREKYADDPSVDVKKIVPVDFVCRDGNIVEATLGNTFDYVVASHVIEHTPNFLRFLANVHAILKPGGRCILVIPDKRFTFDVNRPVTTFGDVLEQFLTEAKSPSISSVYDHFAMATHANGHNLWHGIVDPADSRLLISEKFASDAANLVHNESKYFDVHVNIFTPQSCLEILKKAILHELIFFELEQFQDTQIGQIEFMIALKKSSAEIKDITTACMATFPDLKLESILAPYMPQVKSLSSALQHISKIGEKLQMDLEAIRQELALQRQVAANFEAERDAAQKILNRRSVRLVLAIIDKLFSRWRRE